MWRWLEQMRQRFDMAIELLDRNLECMLDEAASGALGSTLRAATRDLWRTGVRDVAAEALRIGLARTATAYGLRVRVVPLCAAADDAEVTALLVIAACAPGFDDAPTAESEIDRRLEAASHWLAAAIEATLAAVQRDFAQPGRADRLARMVAVASALQELDTGQEIVQLLVEAAGLWTAGARIYRRESSGAFALDACVPAGALLRSPARLSGECVANRDQVFRLGSANEVEAFGWDRPHTETVFAPIGVHDSIDWLIAVPGGADASVGPTLSFLRRIAGLLLENLEGRVHARLYRRLTGILPLCDAPVESTVRIGLEATAPELGASSISLRVEDARHRLPPFSAEWRRDGLDQKGCETAEIFTPMDTSVASGAAVVLTVRTCGRALTAPQSRIAQSMADMFELWISGFLVGEADLQVGSDGAQESDLVGRLKGQLDATGHLKIGGAVAVVFPEPSPPSGPTLDEAMQIVQDNVRASDIIGLVESVGAGVLLPHASERVAAALVARLVAAVRAHGLGAARVGAAMFSPFTELPDALVLRASHAARGESRGSAGR